MKSFLKVLSGCFLFLSSLLFSAEKPLFRFVHLSDIHFVDSIHLQQSPWKDISAKSTRKFDRMPEVLTRFVDWTNKESINLVLITGDILENPGQAKEAWPEIFSLLVRLKSPFFVVPGNHDFGIEQVMPIQYGGTGFWFSFNGFVFAGFQTYTHRWSGMVELAERKSLEGLASLSLTYLDTPIILLTHAPLYPGKIIPDWAPPANAAQIRQVIERCGNVILSLSGHIHVFTYGVEKGVSYVTAPGLVETPDFSFLLWSVYQNRLEGTIISSVNFQPVTGYDKVTVAIPNRFQPGVKENKGKPEARTWPESKGELTKWFGQDWSEYPGSSVISWEKEEVLLPRHSPGWVFWEQETEPTAEAAGKKWFEPEYQPNNWNEGKLPAVFGYRRNQAAKAPVGTKLQSATPSYWRKTFVLVEIPSDRRVMLRVASDKSACVYLNGKLVDEERLSHWANYWNRYVILPATVLKPGENTIAIKLNNTKSSHGYLDVEISAELPPARN
ncbi:MAG: metallophosphoesterase [Candidatus Omnitrophica bacterium]|nr:metallophosphoesterase [Candidatus Omnitrophota bacterium]